VLVELGVGEQRYRAVLEVLDEGMPVTPLAYIRVPLTHAVQVNVRPAW
jgi:hypothetical protein